MKNSKEVAAGILKRCEELCTEAMDAELDILAHLLSLAMLQAAKDLASASLDGDDPLIN